MNTVMRITSGRLVFEICELSTGQFVVKNEFFVFHEVYDTLEAAENLILSFLSDFRAA